MENLPPKIDLHDIRTIAKQVLTLLQQDKVTEAQRAIENIFPAIDEQDNRYHQWSLSLNSLSKYFK